MSVYQAASPDSFATISSTNGSGKGDEDGKRRQSESICFERKDFVHLSFSHYRVVVYQDKK